MMPLLRYGFRPFFLGAGGVAALLIPWWAASYALDIPLSTGWPPTLWHGHEMLFGFIVAAVAGFLLTAAALVRVFGLAVLPVAYPDVILAAAFLWTAAFVLFTWVYAPMLLAPRVDGKPG